MRDASFAMPEASMRCTIWLNFCTVSGEASRLRSLEKCAYLAKLWPAQPNWAMPNTMKIGLRLTRGHIDDCGREIPDGEEKQRNPVNDHSHRRWRHKHPNALDNQENSDRGKNHVKSRSIHAREAKRNGDQTPDDAADSTGSKGFQKLPVARHALQIVELRVGGRGLRSDRSDLETMLQEQGPGCFQHLRLPILRPRQHGQKFVIIFVG